MFRCRSMNYLDMQGATFKGSAEGLSEHSVVANLNLMVVLVVLSGLRTKEVRGGIFVALRLWVKLRNTFELGCFRANHVTSSWISHQSSFLGIIASQARSIQKFLLRRLRSMKYEI